MVCIKIYPEEQLLAKYCVIRNRQLPSELYKLITRLSFLLKKTKAYSSCQDDIWGDDLADMQLISKYNTGIGFLLCGIDISRKHTWVVPLEDKKGIAITNAFQKVLVESDRKSNKILVDQGSEFYSRSWKLWLRDSDVEMYSSRN